MVEQVEGHLIIGLKQTFKHLKNGKGELLYAAKDVENNLLEQVINLANERTLDIVYIDTMKELGKLCGIDVGASVALVLK